MFYRIRHRIIGPVVIVWLVLTTAGVVVRAVLWQRLSRSIDASAESAKVRDSLDELYTDMQAAETGQRGFLLTGDDSYLEPLRIAEGSLSKKFSDLANATAGDQILQADLLELRGLAGVKVAEMKETIEIRRSKGLSAAMTLVNSGKGKETMDRIHEIVRRMRVKPLDIFSAAGAATRRHMEMGQTISLVTGFLGVGAGLLALYLVLLSQMQEKEQRGLMEEKARAEKTVVEKSAFLANMSHEIRTPMNAILGFGELLGQEPLTPKQAEYVRSIRQSSKSLLQLINDILDLSKLEAGKMEVSPEPTDLREIFEFLRSMFGQQAAAKGLKLEFSADNLMPRAVLVDYMRMRQVLVNLLGNAIKFTERGCVTTRAMWHPLAADRSHGTLVIEVEDTGVGISPEKQDEIFKPFVQSEPHRAAENQGTGLGLSIVKRLAEMMGGVINLESRMGKGSVFRLEFTGVQVSVHLPRAEAGDEPEVNFNELRPARLLAVDDNKINLHLLVSMFDETHHKIRTAANGMDALESVRESKPDLVLMDIRMPVMGGRETLDEIRRLPGMELLPVIAVTASSAAEDERSLRNRFSGYLRKPFSRAALFREMSSFLPRVMEQKRTAVATESELPATVPIIFARSEEPPEQLKTELKSMLDDEWPALRDTLAVNQTRAFAEKLERLANASTSERLGSYARQLMSHADRYAVNDLERSLDEFPAIVESLAAR